MDAWIVCTESLHRVVAFQHKGSIAWTVDACPIGSVRLSSVDGDIFKIYESTIGNGNFVVAAQRTGECFEVLRRVVTGKSRKIGRFSGCRFHLQVILPVLHAT